MSKMYEFTVLAYSRDITHYDQILMEELIEACHTLFERCLPTWDQMYMLKVLSYGELQRIYKDKISEADRFISRAHI